MRFDLKMIFLQKIGGLFHGNISKYLRPRLENFGRF